MIKGTRTGMWMLGLLGIGVLGFACREQPEPEAAPAAEPATAEEVLFEENFEGELDEGWTWLRENPDAWRLSDGALEIRLETGNARTVKNALVRPAPDRSEGRYAIDVTVTMLSDPTQQYEQAGITWYTDGEPVFKFVKELIDGELCVFPPKQPMEAAKVHLRIVVDGEQVTTQYRPEAEGEFMTAGQGKLPPAGDDQVSIQGYHGPADAEHWVRFEDFRIVRLED